MAAFVNAPAPPTTPPSVTPLSTVKAFADLSTAAGLVAGEVFVGAVEVGGALTREALGIDGVDLAGWEDSVFEVAAFFGVTLNPAGPPSDGLGCG